MIAFLLLLFLFVISNQANAIYNPLTVPNNRYGMHIVEPNDLQELPPIVNSSGGDWGYVTMILADRDRDIGRWQTIFDYMRREHLIPIIRLATHTEGAYWTKPQKDRFYEIVHILKSLNWPTENRYVILYNEPNHANEWGGTLDPVDYAQTLVTFAQELNAAHEDFFILPAALDVSAGNDGKSMDAGQYLARMIAAKPELLDIIDGWNSHSYPNPAFSGSPYARGRGTLSSYDWELSYLRSLGLNRELPVFITETGWQHSEGKSVWPGFLSTDQVASNLVVASSSIWQDSRIAAITPFIFNYQDIPFDHFSWKPIGGASYYPMVDAYKNIPKQKGEPRQRENYTFVTPLIPKQLVAGSTYTLKAQLENSGQGILQNDGTYKISVVSSTGVIESSTDPLPTIEPFQKGDISVHIKTPEIIDEADVSVILAFSNSETLLQTQIVRFVPPPKIQIRARLGWRSTSNSENVSVLVYENNEVFHKIDHLPMKNGVVSVDGLRNIIPDREYRVVILVPGYLPRQVFSTIGAESTTIYPYRFLPLDFNGDGAFTWLDAQALVHYAPWTALLRFFGP